MFRLHLRGGIGSLLHYFLDALNNIVDLLTSHGEKNRKADTPLKDPPFLLHCQTLYCTCEVDFKVC